jgi:hypothetical protein
MNAHSVNLMNVLKESGLHIETQMCFAFFLQIGVECPVMQKKGLSCTNRKTLGNTYRAVARKGRHIVTVLCVHGCVITTRETIPRIKK